MSNLKLAVAISLAAVLAITGAAEAGRSTRTGGDGGHSSGGGSNSNTPIVVQSGNPQIEQPNVSCKFVITPLGLQIVFENTGGAIPAGKFLNAHIEGVDFDTLEMYLAKPLAKGSSRTGFIAWGGYWDPSKFKGKACIATITD